MRSLLPSKLAITALLRRRRDRWVGAGLMVVLVNVPFWLLEFRYAVSRPLFNADAALALLVSCLGGWWWSAGLALAWVLEALQGLAIGFHFGAIFKFVQTAQFVPLVDPTALLSPVTLTPVVAIVACTAAVVVVKRRLRPGFVEIVSIFLLISAADVANGSGFPMLLEQDASGSMNIQGSPALNLAVSFWAERKGQVAATASTHDSSLSGELVAWVEANRQRSILFVVVESWGDILNADLRAWVESGLASEAAGKSWDLRRTSVLFKGATTAGEIRLLCGTDVHYTHIEQVATDRCLGNILRRSGISTIGLHGFSMNMFDRASWWRAIGFEQRIFDTDLPALAPRCGTLLKGICDSYMVETAVSNLRPATLVYLLTLETHLPLAPVSLTPSEREVCSTHALSSSVCQHAVQIRRLLVRIVSVASQAEPVPFLVVAGDHSPPFFRPQDRSTYSRSTVPLLVARPR